MVDRTWYPRYISEPYSSLAYFDSSEESDNDEPVPVPFSEVDAELPNGPIVTASGQDSESAVSEEAEEHDLPQVKIVSIGGLHGQPTWLRHLVLPPHVKLVKFSFKADQLAEEAGARSGDNIACVELVKLIAHYAADALSDESQVLVFLAHDIGGMVLKQALIRIYESREFAVAATGTSCIMFFGTPHRASFEFPSVSTLYTLFSNHYSGFLGPRLSKTIYRLADDFESLTAEFDSLRRRNSFKILNFYQETPPSDEYEVLVPEFVATMHLDSAINIGIKTSHNSLTDFSRSSSQNLLFALIEDACAGANPDYKEFLRLMAGAGAEVDTRHESNPGYRHLCDWILSSDTMALWMGADPGVASRPLTGPIAEIKSEGEKQPQRSDLTDIPERSRIPTRSFQSVQRTIQTLDIHGSPHGTPILTSSLVAAIRSQRKEKTEIFISLAHPCPTPQPLTKVQLLSSLCNQILNCRAGLFNDARPLVEDIKVAFNTSNLAWRNATMWRLLKSLLQRNFSAKTFIIIHQPSNEVLASPFHELIEDFTAWAHTTNVSCKVLVLREAGPNDSPSGEHLSLSIRDISPTSQTAHAELWKDLEGERKRLCLRKPWLSHPKKNVLESLRSPPMDFVTARLWLGMTDQYPFLVLKLDSGFLPPESVVGWANLILDMIPEAARQWVKSGLTWVTYAARPLTCSELVTTMPGCPENMDEGYVQMVFEEFRRLLCGLVEADGGTVHVASPEIAVQLEAIIHRNQHTSNSKGQSHLAKYETESANESENESSAKEAASHALEHHPHLVIASRCLKYLRVHYDSLKRPASRVSSDSVVRGMAEGLVIVKETNNENLPGGVPSFSYAAKYWLVHAQTWLRDIRKISSISPKAPAIGQSSVDFLSESLRNDDFVRYWMRIRHADADSTSDVNPTNLRPYQVSDLESRLGLNFLDPDDLSKWMAVVQAMHSACDIKGEEIENPKSPLAEALCELDRDMTLDQLIDDGAFDDGSTLFAAFQRGTDSALSHIASKYPDFVDRNCSFLIENAIRLGNSNLLHRVLEDRVVTAPSSGGTPPIFHLIAEFGSIVPDDVLCGKLQSHISYTSDEKRSALHVAAIYGHHALVPVLLNHGSDVSLRDNTGATPLFYAAKYGHYTIVRQLLEANANVWIARKNKQTPLHIASANGFQDIVKILLDQGAKRNAKDRHSNTSLHLTLERYHAEVALVLLDGSTNATVDEKNRSEIELMTKPSTLAATRLSQDDSARILQSRSSRTDLQRGSRPVSPAPVEDWQIGATGSPEVGLDNSVDDFHTDPGADIQNSAGLTPLMLAAKGNLVNVITILLERGANPNLASGDGKTSLHYAAEAGSQESFDELFGTKDINIDIADANGNTPLHLASFSGSISMIRKLLTKGVNSNAINNQGLRPLEVACDRRWSEAVRALIFFCSSSTQTAGLLRAAAARDVVSVGLLLDASADINGKTSSGNTALHHSAYNSDDRIVQVLLTRRARVDLLDGKGRTALMDAVSQNATDCVKMLVDAGANVNVRDNDDVTALFEAAKRGYPRCVEILLNANADLHGPILGGTYKTFLGIALTQFKTNIFRLVVEYVFVRYRDCDVSNDALFSFLQGDDPDVEKIRVLLDSGFNASRDISVYGTMLHYAAGWDNLNLVKLLTEPGRGINLNQINKDHGTPLQIAAQKASPHGPDIVDHLLKRNANARIGSGQYGSPLHAAVVMGEHWDDVQYMRIAKLLLEHDPETLHVIAGQFPTVLQAAVSVGSVGMVEMLLQYNPRFDVVVGPWGTPLHLAARRGNRTVRNKLLRAGYPHLTRSTVDIGGRLPLHLAVMDGNLHGVNSLAREGSARRRVENISEAESSTAEPDDLNHKGPLATRRDNQGRHVLHFCAAQGNVMIARWMLDQHPETLNDRDVDGWTPLHWACRQEDSGIIKYLVKDIKADKNARTNRGWRPIDVAMYHRNQLAGIEEITDLLTSDDSADAAQGLGGYPVGGVEKLPPDTGDRAIHATGVTQYCDSCDCVMYGPRYECEACYDYNMCFKCFRNVKRAHYKGHVFSRFDKWTGKKQLINPWEDEEEGK